MFVSHKGIPLSVRYTSLALLIVSRLDSVSE